MADARDAYTGMTNAEASQRSLAAYCGQAEGDEREANPALIIGLAAVAICDHLYALTIRLDYLAHDVLAKG